MTARREFSKAVRRDAFARANGRCEECGQKLFTGNIEYDHAKEDFFGGEPVFENCVVLCRGCHRVKTNASRPAVDKTRRVSDTAAGIKGRSTFGSSRDKPFKQKIGGQLVHRATGEPVRPEKQP